MSNAYSLSFPNMFDVVHNRVGVLTDSSAVTNRTKLLLLSSPKEMYNSPEFGVGLFGHMFQYVTDNSKAALRDKIISKIEQFEPASVSGSVNVEFVKKDIDGVEPSQDQMQVVVKIGTIFGDILEVDENV